MEGGSKTLIWRLRGQQSASGWLQATVPYSRAATFEFQGIVGNGNRSDIGLDDLNPVSGTCDVTPPAARVELPSTSPIMPRTTITSVTRSGTGTPKATEGAPLPTFTTSGQTEQPKTETTVTNVMRTEGQKGAEPLAIALGVTGGIVAVILLVIVAWFITKRRSRLV
eukprot:XP_011672764.1 PREDICTED: MAM and LDL-receptor class A domain-containing protein 1 isoform X2 [Strongylocentrotus purpuratus]